MESDQDIVDQVYAAVKSLNAAMERAYKRSMKIEINERHKQIISRLDSCPILYVDVLRKLEESRNA